MGRIVWLASYPKSGNTWMRALLTNYLLEADGPADINNLLGGPIASDRHTFDELAGVESADLSPDEVARWRPEVYRLLARESDGLLFVKAHDACRRGSVQFFPQDVTALAIYIIRNPLDVAVSLASHLDISLDGAVARVCEGLTLAQSGERLRDQLEQVVLSWSAHVCSWVDEPAFPNHVVRFEDLLTDPQRTFRGVLTALNSPIDEERMARAIERSRFAELKGQEARGGFLERLSRTDPFFRQGREGGWREVLSEAQHERIVAANPEVMSRFGYFEAMQGRRGLYGI